MMIHKSRSTYRQQVRMRLGGIERLDLYVEDVDPRIVFERQEGLCALCFTPMEEYQLDHARPISADGQHSYANVQAVHAGCNQAKMSLDREVAYRYRFYHQGMKEMAKAWVKQELDLYIDQQCAALLEES